MDEQGSNWEDRFRSSNFIPLADQHGNVIAQEGCDRCFCGCKYWENDKCIDCGTSAVVVKYSDGD